MNTLYLDPNETMGVTDSESIQNAVDRAKECGINKVVIPRYNARTDETVWVISEAIKLPTGMTVVLDNCYLVMADGVMTNFFRNSNAYTALATKKEGKQYGITIKGEGCAVLDGGTPNGLSEATSCLETRPHVSLNHPIFFINVEGFSVENITVSNQRYYGMRFEFCSRGRVRDIFTDVRCDRPNQGCVDVRCGCHDILIENIHGQSGDDMVRLSALDVPENGGYNFILEDEAWDIRGISIRGVSGAAVGHSLVSIKAHNGACIFNVTVDNLSDTDGTVAALGGESERASLVSIGSNTDFATRPAVMGEISNISLSNIHTLYSTRAISLRGAVKNCHISNVHAAGMAKTVISSSNGDATDVGVSLESVTVDGIYFSPAEKSGTRVVDFALMREGDYVKGLYVTGAHLEDVEAIAEIDEAVAESVDIRTWAVLSGDEESMQTIITPREQD